MNLPIQAAPVMRGSARAYQTQTVAQSCDWLACAGKLVSCLGSCIPDPFTPGCLACLGPLWNTCKDCF